MEKTIAERDAQQQLRQLLDDVRDRSANYVIERDGQPVAALVPVKILEIWLREREAFFETLAGAANEANMDPDEADALALEAVQAVRAEQQQKQ